jgi:hypothetical protein
MRGKVLIVALILVFAAGAAYAQSSKTAMGILRIKAHDEDAQTHQNQDDGPAVGPAFPIPEKVLKEHHQANAADETARYGQPGQRFAAQEHPDEEQSPQADDDERPEIIPEWETSKKLPEQGQQAEGDEDRSSHQHAGISFDGHIHPPFEFYPF